MTDFDIGARQLLALNPPARVALSKMKRPFDVTIALVALLLFAPLLALVALAIFIEDRGPLLFRQRRTGLNGKVFTILKFRSMSVAEDCGEIRQATRADSRVTRVGAVIRALSVDELPQLFNVLRGDMSLVGPRPHAVSHDQTWGGLVPAYEARFRTRPGLTGYAQVRGLRGEVRSVADIKARIDADNYYIENWSPLLELSILIRTLPVLFHDPRAY